MERRTEGGIPSLFPGFDFKLVINFVFARNLSSLSANRVLLLLVIDGPFQGYFAILGDDLCVFRVHRQGSVLNDGLSDFLSQRQIVFTIGLLLRGFGILVLLGRVSLGVI